ncbi:MAG: hypothetical protein JSS61_01545 [Verrucomicrobia bacterium]|nr:hypothetical protein [Verrucomicrobiota bacterium]
MRIFLLLAICVGLYFFTESKTRGFRLYKLLSNLPNDARWATSEPSKEIDALLSQRFTYLGAGGWCTAFLGEDQKTVLKFYTHSHLSPLAIIKDFSLAKLLFQKEPLHEGTSYFQEFNFESCSLLYNKVKERTGLLYVHLNKQPGIHPHVTLVDPIGVIHQIDVNETEFVLQKRADPLLPYLEGLMKQGKIEEAKRSLGDFLAMLRELSQAGLRDLDLGLRSNYGFIEGKAVVFDLSSFVYDESLQNPDDANQEIQTRTVRLKRWIKKYQPELESYFSEHLSSLQ